LFIYKENLKKEREILFNPYIGDKMKFNKTIGEMNETELNQFSKDLAELIQTAIVVITAKEIYKILKKVEK